MGCVNGRWVWRGEWRGKRRGREEKKRKELVWQGKDKTQIWAHNMNKFTKMPL